MNEKNANNTDESESQVVRPNSSRFPPIASPSPPSSAHPSSATSSKDKRVSFENKSTSFDIKYNVVKQRPSSSSSSSSSNCKHIHNNDADLYDPNIIAFPVLSKDIKCERSSESFKRDMKISHIEHEIENKTRELVKLKNEMKQIRPISPYDDLIDYFDHWEEVERLRKENEKLKHNFIKMSEIIKKCHKQLSRKDDIILKLHQKSVSSENELKSDFSSDGTDDEHYFQNFAHNKIGDEKLNILIVFQECILKPLFQWKESGLSENQLSMKISNILKKIVIQFWPQFIQLNNIINDMKMYHKNQMQSDTDLNTDQDKNSLTSKLEAINKEYNQIKEINEDLLQKSTKLKESLDQFYHYFDITVTDDTAENLEVIKNLHKSLQESSHQLALQLDALKKSYKHEEDIIFQMIERMADIELELELKGRTPTTLQDAIIRFESHSNTNNHIPIPLYLEPLKKMILQIYNNQLKLSERNPINDNFMQWESTDDEDNNNNNNGDETKNSGMSENRVEKVINEEIIDRLSILENEQLIELMGDIDVDSINYILMTRPIKPNVGSILKVIKEEDEEEEVINEEFVNKTIETNNNQFSSCFINSDTDSDIEFAVKEMIEDVINLVENKHKEKSESEEVQNMEVKETFNATSEVNDFTEILEEPFAKIVVTDSTTHNDSVANKTGELNDSAFVSDETCSSPEASTSTDQTIISSVNNEYNCNEQVMQVKSSDEDIILATKLEELEKQRDSQAAELNIARSRIAQLESLADTKSDNKPHYEQRFNDELRAWKELVEQQKAIMEKIKDELDATQSRLQERETEISLLKRPSSQLSQNSVKLEVETQTETDNDKFIGISSDNQVSHEYSIEKLNDENLLDEDHYGLEFLFDDKQWDSNETGVDDELFYENKIDLIISDVEDEEETLSVQNDNILLIQNWLQPNDACNNSNSSMSGLGAKNISSDESIYSTDSEKGAISLPSEDIHKNLSPTFTAEETPRRHSCQDRVYYGHHPRKRPLKLNSVEIVFHSEIKGKNTKRNQR